MVAQKAFLAALLASSSLVAAGRWTVRDHYKYVDEHHDEEDHHDGDNHYDGDDHHDDSDGYYSEAKLVAHSYQPSKGASVPDIYAAAVSNPTTTYSGVAPSIISKAVASAGHTYYSSDYSSYADVISKALASASGIIATNPSAAGSIISAAVASASHVANSSATITGSSSSKAEVTALPFPTKGSSSLSAKNGTSTITAAPQTTVSLFNACAGAASICSSIIDLTYFGSVVTADSSKAVYALDCSKRGRNGTTECFSQPMTVTQGSSLFARVYTSESIPRTVSCNIHSRVSSAVCADNYRPTSAGAVTASAAVPRASGNASVATNSYTFDRNQIYYNALVITKGSEKLNSNGTIATRTPSGPSSALPSASAAAASGSANAAGAVVAPVASMAGIAAIVMAVFAL